MKTEVTSELWIVVWVRFSASTSESTIRSHLICVSASFTFFPLLLISLRIRDRLPIGHQQSYFSRFLPFGHSILFVVCCVRVREWTNDDVSAENEIGYPGRVRYLKPKYDPKHGVDSITC